MPLCACRRAGPADARPREDRRGGYGGGAGIGAAQICARLEAPDDAVQLLVGKGAEEMRVWVHPQTGQVLAATPEEGRFMRVIFRLHGELLAGDLDRRWSRSPPAGRS